MDLLYGLYVVLANLLLFLAAPNLFPGSSLGLIELPFNILCNTTVISSETCLACHHDCKDVHNTYGGICARVPGEATEMTCFCAKSQADADKFGITESAIETCKLPNNLFFRGNDLFVKFVFLLRFFVLLCDERPNGDITTKGCSTDCIYNHNGLGGSCQKTSPIYTPGGAKSLHCQCQWKPDR